FMGCESNLRHWIILIFFSMKIKHFHRSWLYATIRIRGAILDELRRSHWAPKSVHKKARDLSVTIQEIELRTGRDARDVEVAQEMGISMSEYYQILKDASACRMLRFDDLGTDDTQSLGIFEDRG
ncbi:MAG: hypothetical protein LC437_09780, partial [Thiohalomonas sp.]|nr:hypothetical protein [Thiohalomonas sp.]